MKKEYIKPELMVVNIAPEFQMLVSTSTVYSFEKQGETTLNPQNIDNEIEFY